jgi:hypothetical protein
LRGFSRLSEKKRRFDKGRQKFGLEPYTVDQKEGYKRRVKD